MNHLIPFIHENWYLVILLVLLVIAYLAVEFRDRSHGVPAVSAQRAVTLSNREKATFIDIRSQEAFDKGHIADAKHFEGGNIDNEIVLKKLKKAPVIVVCERGISAKAAAAKLKKQDLDVYVLTGGLTAWRQEHMPVVKS